MLDLRLIRSDTDAVREAALALREQGRSQGSIPP